ncbi:hypothetical protein GCM10017643_20520 [Ancylobacter dichloromethanicus]|uniref:Uncharacterized protein n=1 Tax=Ancylobacter dichloromethanicus TaxID=518825 RepID=A0A9W6MZB8_9HYPH|nr:hypothetical protein GCM10017643_20520 [Ancylobacter dichloromethanicus]
MSIDPCRAPSQGPAAHWDGSPEARRTRSRKAPSSIAARSHLGIAQVEIVYVSTINAYAPV